MNLSAINPQTEPQKPTNINNNRPIGFISYSWDSKEHQKRVLKLANSLRLHGVNCELDIYHVSPLEGWQHWMLNNLKRSDFVIIVCTEQYYNKFHQNTPGEGKGVGFESDILMLQIYERNRNSEKPSHFIPVIYDENDKQYIPEPIKIFSYYCLETLHKGQENYDVDKHQEYQNLYRHVTNQPSVTRPEIGDLIDLSNNPIPNLFNSQIHNTGELEQEKILNRAKVCIVYDPKSETHQKKVRQLQEILKRYQIQCVPNKDDLIGLRPRKCMLQDRVKIEEFDFFLILSSTHKQESNELLEEANLILELNEEKYNFDAYIQGMYQEDSDLCYEILDIKDIKIGQNDNQIINLLKERDYQGILIGNKIDKDILGEIVKVLTPKVTIIHDIEAQNPLIELGLKCYEKIFEHEKERDNIDDIREWLSESQGEKDPNCYELYAVMHFGEDLVVGIGYLTCYKKESWCFGNYFGILPIFRQEGRAKWFLDSLGDEVKKFAPQTKGIIFEIQAIDFQLMEELQQREQIFSDTFLETGTENTEDTEILRNLRAIKRLNFFQQPPVKALTILKTDGFPLPFVQPALHEPDSGKEFKDYERDYMLMTYSFNNSEQIVIQELIHLVYDIWYSDAYGEGADAEIEGYDDYLESLKESCLQNYVTEELKLGKFQVRKIIKNWRSLEKRCKQEGVSLKRLKL